ncbi:nuclear export protein Noc3 [Paecilomyces variotii No. 5]|uniref:Nucleolar complex-associated protein 3 n=1 Tax=Byssochlamys spectabilis (strain No. 5 / NBRC 109023) TaxID=1356009 RepID=V5I681_BYSSN|nr:nuclear export protein Noc3 [Paecilomyces variotii No. 5]
MAPGRTVKRRRLTPPDDEVSSKQNSKKASVNDFYSHAAEWDLEQDYERRPRKAKKDKEQSRLPIKTAEGNIEHVKTQVAEEDSDSFFDTDDDDEDEQTAAPEPEPEKVPEQPKIPLKLQIIQAKEELARLAGLINEDPEEHVSAFKKLTDMVDNASHPTIKKLALAAQAAIYRDVIPGYRIRPLSEEDMSAKISKEVRKVRNYEQALLSGYKSYVQHLSSFAGRQKGQQQEVDPGLRTVAINCSCSLLLAVPHFNFRGELLKILVNRLAKRPVDGDFIKCRETMEEIFEKDNDGIVSLEAVGLLAKMMKAKDFRIHESVLDTFLHLRLLSEFSAKGSRDRITREAEEEEPVRGKKKEKKEFRTKKLRKLLKERKAVEKDMKEADALVSHEQRDKNQAETLKLVFGVYFRILKQRIPNLMGAVLEGLAKYAHLINQDFFGDLLEALKDLISQTEVGEAEEEEDESQDAGVPSTRNALRETLLCTITAFALLEGQDASKAAASLHLDLSFFITHIYRALYPLSTHPDIEFNPDVSLRLPDPGSRESQKDPSELVQKPRTKVNFQTPTVLLLRCLNSILLSRSHGIPPPIRLAGFSKRLMTASLQLPEKSSLAALSLLTRVTKHHGRKIAPLWNTEERKGDGVFKPLAPDVEQSNVFAATVWEGELLKLHYCPQVRDAALDVEKMIAGVK